MNYLTTKEISKIWGISARRISLLCGENRIEGAVKKGKTWLIPEDAKKPEDPRRVRKMVDGTPDYYNEKAAEFVERTVDVQFTAVQDTFLKYIPNGGKILDFGCGSGRDTKYFLSKGYDVEAIDGSEELCKIAGKYAGIPVKKMLFEELDSIDEYDGIWACASILHVIKENCQTFYIKWLMRLELMAWCMFLLNMAILKAQRMVDILHILRRIVLRDY